MPCDDPNAAAKALLGLLDDPAVACRMAEAALETCTRYQWSSVRAEWVALYRRMAHARVVAAPTPA